MWQRPVSKETRVPHGHFNRRSDARSTSESRLFERCNYFHPCLNTQAEGFVFCLLHWSKSSSCFFFGVCLQADGSHAPTIISSILFHRFVIPWRPKTSTTNLLESLVMYDSTMCNKSRSQICIPACRGDWFCFVRVHVTI